MPTIKVEPDDIIDRLMEVFRTVGYDGATLSKLSKATGLQRASLYHRFPGGKKAMAEAVLAHAGAWLDTHVLTPLMGSGTPQARLQKMAEALDTFYVQGGKSCLLDSLSFGEEVPSSTNTSAPPLRTGLRRLRASWSRAQVAPQPRRAGGLKMRS